MIKRSADDKSSLHPRNRNNGRYDFPLLVERYPELKQFVFINKHKRETIDFANPDAVRTLNKVLLFHFYGLEFWDIPKNYLCPPIPGRADYIHHIADLLGSCNDGNIPRNNSVTALDLGVGANCIYPIIGSKEYGWKFIGSDIDPVAIESATQIVTKNNFPADAIELRRQEDPSALFKGIVSANERIDITLCNPPFHSSLEQAAARTKRKWKNLGLLKQKDLPLNFGGQSNELVYPGGEESFIGLIIDESKELKENIFWFTTLVSKQSNLPVINNRLKKIGVTKVRTIDMAQGQKKSRIVAWTFFDTKQREKWKTARWKSNSGIL